MATATDPTATTLKTEAFAKAGITASAGQLSRADRWLQEVFNEIWMKTTASGNSRLKSLQNETLLIPVKGTRYVTLPEEFDEEISIVLWYGTETGTAQSGGASAIRLASSATSTESDVVGRTIVLLSGTGLRQFRQCIAYNTTTKDVTVDRAWDTTPDNTSVYLIVKNTRSLDEDTTNAFHQVSAAPTMGKPVYFSKQNRQLIFDRPFDSNTYALYMSYFMHINQVDLTEGSTYRLTRLFREWNAVLVQGLYYKVLKDIDDNRQHTEQQIFDGLTSNLLLKEIPYGGEFTGFSL